LNKVTPIGLSPAWPGTDEAWVELIVQSWADIDAGDAGAASREALDRLRDQVTECLSQSPPDVSRAGSLTVQAFSLMQGIAEA
jgi:hypothetical protein